MKRTATILLLVFAFFTHLGLRAQTTTLYSDFNSGTTTPFTAIKAGTSVTYNLTSLGTELQLVRGSDASWSFIQIWLNGQNFNLDRAPAFRLDLMTSVNTNVSVLVKDITDKSFSVTKSVTGNAGVYQDVFIDLSSKMNTLNTPVIKEIQLNFSANTTYKIDNFRLGDDAYHDCNHPPYMDVLASQQAGMNVTTNIPLTGIDDGEGDEEQGITFTVDGFNTGLLNASVNYTSGSTGTLQIVPVTDATGVTTVNVTLNDHGGTTGNGKETRTYPVQVEVLSTTGILQNFNDGQLIGWSKANDPDNRQFSALSIENNALKVGMFKSADPRYYVEYSFVSRNFSAAPYLSLDIKTTTEMLLHLAVVDATGKQSSWAKVEVVPYTHDNGFVTYSINLNSIKGTCDLSQITKIRISPNHSVPINGTMYIDNLRAGDLSVLTPNITVVPDQGTPKNSPQKTLYFRAVSNITGATDNITITATESSPAIDELTVHYTPNQSVGSITFTPAADATGVAEVTLTVSAPNMTNKVLKFNIDVESDAAPTIDPTADQYVAKQVENMILIKGIGDGDSYGRQDITVTAVSSNPGILNPLVVYNSDNPYAYIKVTPANSVGSSATITVTVEDEGGNEVSDDFVLTIANSINHAPTLNPLSDVDYPEGRFMEVLLDGISNGGDGSQLVDIDVEVSPSDFFSFVDLQYTPGDTRGKIVFEAAPGKQGTASVTVTASDEMPGSNLPVGQIARQFDFTISAKRPEHFDDADFSFIRTAGGWLPPSYSLASTESGTATMMTVTNKSDAWGHNIMRNLQDDAAQPVILDISNYPYMSVQVKFEQTSGPNKGKIGFWIGSGSNRSSGDWPEVPADGQYHTYFWDMNAVLGSDVDRTAIDHMMIVADPGAVGFSGRFYLKELHIGSTAEGLPASVVMPTSSGISDEVLFENSGEQTIEITGITDGLKNNDYTVSIDASVNNTQLISDISVVYSGGETATLHYTPAASATGEALVTVTLSADYPASTNDTTYQDKVITFKIGVFDRSYYSNANIVADVTETYQTIEGFGGTDATGDQADVPDFVEPFGFSMIRLGLELLPSWEPVNDNSDPNVIDFSNFDYDAIPVERLKRYKEQNVRIIVTAWSQPAWMKRNKSTRAYVAGAPTWEDAEDNVLEPHYYEEYAEHIVAYIKAVKMLTGIDIYAVGPQNEPGFNEPYPSAVMDAPHWMQFLKILGPRLEAEGLSDVKIFMPEDMFNQGRTMTYMDALKADPDAAQYVYAFAVHGYDATGTGSGELNSSAWAEYYNDCQEFNPPLKVWMTETSGIAESWINAVKYAKAIHLALKGGKVSAWTWWSISGNSEEYCLIVDGVPSMRLYAAKHYYKFLEPGYEMFKINSDISSLLVTGFMHPEKGTYVINIINDSNSPQAFTLEGSNLPNKYMVYQSTSNRRCEYVGDLETTEIALPPQSITTLYAEYNSPLTIDQLGEQVLLKNSAGQQVSLTGIGGTTVTDVVAVASDPSMLTGVVVTGWSGSTATLNFTPVTNAFGESKIYVTVKGDDPQKDRVMTVPVRILAYVNQAPVVDAVPQQNLAFKASDIRTVKLTGIGDGNPEEAQNLSLKYLRRDGQSAETWVTYTPNEDTAIVSFLIKKEGVTTFHYNLSDDGPSDLGGSNSTDFSIVVNISKSNAVATLSSSKMYVYPNPASEILSVVVPEGEKINSLRVYDFSGRVVYSQATVNQSPRIELSVAKLDKGAYTLVLKGQKSDYQTIFVKE